MDAISECEYLVRTEGGSEEEAPWQLHYRKELFSPWHDVELDDVATELIYRQIIHAVHANEYTLRSVSQSLKYKFWAQELWKNLGPYCKLKWPLSTCFYH